MKSSRWLLLRNRDNLSPQQGVQLSELLAANQSLLAVHLLRDSLKRLWRYRRQGWAEKAWAQWYQQARDSGIGALKRFADKLKPHLHGILSRCRYPLDTSVVEGINNTIKVIKRRAYGYRDQDYFFLKISDAFPGNPRQTQKKPRHGGRGLKGSAVVRCVSAPGTPRDGCWRDLPRCRWYRSGWFHRNPPASCGHR